MALGGFVFAILGFWMLSEEKLSVTGRFVSGGKTQSEVENPNDF